MTIVQAALITKRPLEMTLVTDATEIEIIFTDRRNRGAIVRKGATDERAD